MKILVFTEGTVLMHAAGAGKSRVERVSQVEDGAAGVRDFSSYVPIGNAVNQLKRWKDQGCEIVYLTSRTAPNEIDAIRTVLSRYGFPDHRNLFFRIENEAYQAVVERLMPDILIEDDCESIGGEPQMTYTHLAPGVKQKIKSIVVKEFGGIDTLPGNLEILVDVRS